MSLEILLKTELKLYINLERINFFTCSFFYPEIMSLCSNLVLYLLKLLSNGFKINTELLKCVPQYIRVFISFGIENLVKWLDKR